MILLPLTTSDRLWSIYGPSEVPDKYRAVHRGVTDQGHGIAVIELFSDAEADAVAEALNQAQRGEYQRRASK